MAAGAGGMAGVPAPAPVPAARAPGASLVIALPRCTVEDLAVASVDKQARATPRPAFVRIKVICF